MWLGGEGTGVVHPFAVPDPAGGAEVARGVCPPVGLVWVGWIGMDKRGGGCMGWGWLGIVARGQGRSTRAGGTEHDVGTTAQAALWGRPQLSVPLSFSIRPHTTRHGTDNSFFKDRVSHCRGQAVERPFVSCCLRPWHLRPLYLFHECNRCNWCPRRRGG